ncbi:MAG: hypothetical protein IT381_21275 [Deltaproteobacteria bacterium]|nr:hypothetical protein [Deltaproteobacteria bacterium]
MNGLLLLSLLAAAPTVEGTACDTAFVDALTEHVDREWTAPLPISRIAIDCSSRRAMLYADTLLRRVLALPADAALTADGARVVALFIDAAAKRNEAAVAADLAPSPALFERNSVRDFQIIVEAHKRRMRLLGTILGPTGLGLMTIGAVLLGVGFSGLVIQGDVINPAPALAGFALLVIGAVAAPPGLVAWGLSYRTPQPYDPTGGEKAMRRAGIALMAIGGAGLLMSSVTLALFTLGVDRNGTFVAMTLGAALGTQLIPVGGVLVGAAKLGPPRFGLAPTKNGINVALGGAF